MPKTNRSRPIHIHVRVSAREKALIDRRMEQAGIRNLNSYMRKMALNGSIVRLDMSDVRQLVVLLRRVGTNVNQIARRVNESHNLYADDVEDIRNGVAKLWKALNALLKKWEGLYIRKKP